MSKIGESPAKRPKEAHGARRSWASRTKREEREEWYFWVRFRLRGWPETLEQLVVALIQQVMEMIDRMRQSKESAEKTECLSGLCQKHWELMKGDSDMKRLRREINQAASAARTLRDETCPRVQRGRAQGSRAIQARSEEKASVTELDFKLEDAQLRGVAADFHHAQTPFLQRECADGCLDQHKV